MLLALAASVVHKDNFFGILGEAGGLTLLAAGLRRPGLGTLATSNPDIQAVGNWARYRGLGTQAEADDEQS